MQEFFLTLANEDFLLPLSEAPDPGPRWEPTQMPASWRRSSIGLWDAWSPEHSLVPPFGWKIHVSAQKDSAQRILDLVAAVCVEESTPFKHVSRELFYLAMHHKHASRQQAGKFITIYPADVPVARTIMNSLARSLEGERGPYVLSDRRYGKEGVVFYRYGSYRERRQLQLDGSGIPLVVDGRGHLVADRREPYFVLPAGVQDPFADAEADPSPAAVVLNGKYEIGGVLQHSNGGGSYRARDLSNSRTVFIKEARAHCGLDGSGADAQQRLRREFETLRYIERAAPGLAPRPVDLFQEWENLYMVTEYIEGHNMLRWVAAYGDLHQLNSGVKRGTAFADRARKLVASLRSTIDTLHTIGLRFGDLSHGNVLVLPDNTARLIDFETASRLSAEPVGIYTPGYAPPSDLQAQGVSSDEYGFSALCMLLLFPFSTPLERDPDGRLPLIKRDLSAVSTIPPDIWSLATRYHRNRTGPDRSDWPHDLPDPIQLETRPTSTLSDLADGLATGLVEMARPERDDWLFPPPAIGYQTNTVCLAHGSAGVLHALRQHGHPIPDHIVTRFRCDALRLSDALPPGIQAGTAGVAWVLAELGYLDEAQDLIRSATAHQLAGASPFLWHGRAGIGLAQIELSDYLNGDPELLAAAVRSADAMVSGPIENLRRPSSEPGLQTGFSGMALFLLAVAERTKDIRHSRYAIKLAHAELDLADTTPDGMLLFRDASGGRTMTYLGVGSAGVAFALSRVVAATADERCAAALGRILPSLRAAFAMYPGLYSGVAGWSVALAEHASAVGGGRAESAAIQTATGLAKYLIRCPTGLRTLGALDSRFHADLGSGSSGVLLALLRVLRGPVIQLLPGVGGVTFAPAGDGQVASRQIAGLDSATERRW